MKPTSRRRSLLLDTDVLINILKRIRGYSWLPYHHSFTLYYVSVSKKELYGKRGLSKAEANAIAKILGGMRCINIDDRILKYYNALLKKYSHHGLLKADALIAATAWAKNLPLVTGNASDFAFYQGNNNHLARRTYWENLEGLN